ncbi:MAG: hypothetical protein SFU99_18280 [Saprospiraceae bacterium]|nr:hypothetical protein [Saprospiraceae bacterium]
MDIQQAKILVEKIASLQKSIALNKGPIAAIERDLMLSYIRQLYELYLNSDEPALPPKIAGNTEEVKIAPKPVEVEQPRSTYTPPKIEIPESPKYTAPPKQEAPPPLAPKVEEVKREMPPPAPSIQRPSGNSQQNFSALFDFRQAKELSEKLSERPVTDLTKAFSINDKLLYINELFGRDANAFNDSLLLMNKFENMEEAKSLLMSLAEQNNWTHDEKLEIAQSFIKTVRRRYV